MFGYCLRQFGLLQQKYHSLAQTKHLFLMVSEAEKSRIKMLAVLMSGKAPLSTS